MEFEDIAAAEPESESPSNIKVAPFVVGERFNQEQNREETREDLARGLLWLLTFVIGGVLTFVGLGRLDGTAITQSVFPSLIALAGTALGFYFGSQVAKSAEAPATAGKTGPDAPNPQPQQNGN